MGHTEIISEGKKGTHVTWEDRLLLQRLLYKSKITSPTKLSLILGKSKPYRMKNPPPC